MSEPNWLLADAVIAVHAALLAEHGGAAGVRDRGSLDSALARPVNRFHYEPGTSLFDLAAAYGYGIARNHPFVDGNKRTAITAVAMFLGDNGHRLRPDKMDMLRTVLRLAAGEIDEAELGRWIAANAEPG